MIDASQVSELSWVDLAESFWLGAREFYKDPANRKAFEEWQKKRKEKPADDKTK